MTIIKSTIYSFLLLGIAFVLYSFFNSNIKPASCDSTLLINGTIHIGNGNIIKNGAVGMRNGVIDYVGPMSRVSTIKYAKKINIQKKHVYPSFIDINSTLGLVEIDAVRATNDMNEMGKYNASVRSLTAFNTDSRITPTAISNGVLVAQITPRGGIISGKSSIMYLNGWNWEDAVIEVDDGMHMHWPKNYNRKGWWANSGKIEENNKYVKEVKSITQYFIDAKAYCEVSNNKVKNLNYEAFRAIFNGKRKLYIEANSSRQILDLILFKKQLNLKNVVLIGGYDADLVSQELIRERIPVVLQRIHGLPERDFDHLDHLYTLPLTLQKLGVTYCLSNQGEMERINSRNLSFYAGTAIANGLDKEDALSTITLNTANILGIDNILGSVEEGKHATLFVSTGDALDMRTHNIEYIFIKGCQQPIENHQEKRANTYQKKYEGRLSN